MNLPCLYYTTFSSKAEAEELVEILLKEELIACANILPEVTSLFRFNGEVKKTSETVAILKSDQKALEKIREVYKLKHSYDTPCLLALDIVNGDPDFLSWLTEQINL